ncbi:MAG: hypothetical protein JXA74_17040 [Anaerolineae bacterium]|nr:hypothetical protein [Anaerolineae bacterium]
MGTRRLWLTVVLALLSAVLLAAPVQAGRTATPFVFQMVGCESGQVGLDCGYYETGAAQHWDCLLTGPVAGGPEAVTGYLTWRQTGPCIVDHPYSAGDGAWWGPAKAEWKLAVSDGSGWMGHGHTDPWTDPDKWPNSGMEHAKGVGYGDYGGMYIEFTFQLVGGPCDWVFQGEIAEKSH